MKFPYISLVVLALAATNAHADTPSTSLNRVMVRDQGRLVVDCRDERLPTMRSVGEVLQINNGARIYAERERLAHFAHRECLRGAPSVTFLREIADTVPRLALAAQSR
jgi:hypothetical protein